MAQKPSIFEHIVIFIWQTSKEMYFDYYLDHIISEVSDY